MHVESSLALTVVAAGSRWKSAAVWQLGAVHDIELIEGLHQQCC
jgi:hypothetical protein